MKYRSTGEILGAGVSGAILRGIDEHGTQVAMKTLRAGNFTKTSEKMVKHFSREVELLLLVRNPHIVELLDAFEGPSSITIVTELLQGSGHETL
ncbi:Dual specificity protein kinase shkB (SH2 domain-containing protein 2) (SH2 domain-containing protein B) [Durusdinium trenchii]|uniref:Dual specificity protein kinase shkB (SH2 domain-containing protein 2) (SH2 domain-containing protein B) n=1 Tax=Durusdinium trenchii TaxID=1381693 RepID=A0ABP0PW16_9DINO